jgi:ABC-2 type transport system permease protein
MLDDLRTVMWKEWREYLPRAGERRGPLLSILVVLVVFGVLQPSQLAANWLTSWPVFVVALIVPSAVVAGVVADAFAGERERHTLETLLASRLPDRAILFGKLVAAVAYGWGVALLTLLVGAVVVNLKSSGAGFYRGDVLAGVVLLTFLMALLSASSGVLISLRSATVRQAQQLISLIVVIPALLPTFALTALSASQRRDLLHTLSQATLFQIALLVGAVLLLVDVILLAAAMQRFQRARLVVEAQ